jgi:methionyl-tRNA formyltransferase
MRVQEPALRIAFAGDRDIATWVLDYLIGRGVRPVALVLSLPQKATHASQLQSLSGVPTNRVFAGAELASDQAGRALRDLQLDWIVCVHYPHLIPSDVLRIPRCGVLNLHPAFLPYNRGWHTPTWAILDDSPAGATLHVMDEGLDTGDIIVQRQLEISPADTAHTLYARLKALELEVFKEGWEAIEDGSYARRQQSDRGSVHRRRDLEAVQRIVLDEQVRAGELLRRLRALTTSDVKEAAFFEVAGRRYRVRVSIQVEPSGATP